MVTCRHCSKTIRKVDLPHHEPIWVSLQGHSRVCIPFGDSFLAHEPEAPRPDLDDLLALERELAAL
jgi:hypothetical protein